MGPLSRPGKGPRAHPAQFSARCAGLGGVPSLGDGIHQDLVRHVGTESDGGFACVQIHYGLTDAGNGGQSLLHMLLKGIPPGTSMKFFRRSEMNVSMN